MADGGSAPTPDRSLSATIGIAVVTVAVLFVASCGGSAEPDQMPLADDSEQAVSKVVDAVTTFPTELDPRVWEGARMKPDVRDAILRVVNRVVDDAGIDGLTVDAVDLFGSNASYEWDDKSDVGAHVFVHKPDMTDDELQPLMRLLNTEIESRQEGRITLYGLPLEVSFHAGRSANYQPSAGIGQYSVTDGRWVVEPIQQPDNFDRDQMKVDATRFIGGYNSLVREYFDTKKGFDCSRFGALDSEMSAYRNSGFEQGLGSRSTQNLTYRALRRVDVEIPEMVDQLEDECIYVNESVG